MTELKGTVMSNSKTIRSGVLLWGLPPRLLVLTAVSLSLLSSDAAAGEPQPDRASLEFFENKIRPVLVEHCYK